MRSSSICGLSRWVACIFGSILIFFLLNSPTLQAQEQEEVQFTIYHWPRWVKGFDLDFRAMGHFGTGESLNTPPGGFFLNASGHIWWDHLIELHANLGVGVTHGMFLFGGGTKLNLLEFTADPTGEMQARGYQRGLASKFLKNVMFFASFDYNHYSFPTPDPALGLDYPTSVWAIQPGVGAQWYIFLKQDWARRFYIETSGSFMRISGNNYVVPSLSFGAELR